MMNFLSFLDEARFHSFDKEMLYDVVEDRAQVDKFFSWLNYHIRKAYHTHITWEEIFESHVQNGYYSSLQQLFEDELLYITTSLKEKKPLDGDSLNLYVLEYIKSPDFRKDKIKSI